MRTVRRVARLLLIVALCALPAAGYGATIRSTDIYAADNNGSQTLTSGNGVKTGHIQNKAVTNAKLFGNISGAKLMNNTVTGAKIAAGTITGSNLAAASIDTTAIVDGAVTTAKILNGAVTDTHISGTISGSKLGAHGHNASDIVGTINISNLPVGTTSGTVAVGDHSHDSAYQKKYANVIVVAKSGGDFTDPIAAMASITDASVANPYLIKIMPGEYIINTSNEVHFILKPYVDIEGAGENVTKIKGTFSPVHAISDLGNVEVKHLTIEADGQGVGDGVALFVTGKGLKLSHVTLYSYNTDTPCTVQHYNYMGGKLYLSNVTVIAYGASFSAGVYSSAATTVVSDSTIISSAIQSYGVWSVYGATVEINRTNITASDLALKSTHASKVTIKGSSVKAPTIVSNNDNSTLMAAYTQFDGTLAISGMSCFGVYDANYAPITCP